MPSKNIITVTVLMHRQILKLTSDKTHDNQGAEFVAKLAKLGLKIYLKDALV